MTSSIDQKIQNLIDAAKTVTNDDTNNLTSQVQVLIDGYGVGGIDTSEDTVTSETMLEGVTAHDASGQQITGNIQTYDGDRLEIMSDDGLLTLNTAGKYCSYDIEVQPALQNKIVTENGVITADEGYVGLKSVTVEVAGSDGGLYDSDGAMVASWDELIYYYRMCPSINYDSSGDMSFTNMPNSPYNKLQNTKLLSGCNLVISKKLQMIGLNAFRNCQTLTSVTIPGSITIENGYSFRDCRNLTSVIFCDGSKWVGPSAFYGCSKLTHVVMPDSITTINSSAFYGCTNLTNVDIPDNVIFLGGEAFEGCNIPFLDYEDGRYLNSISDPCRFFIKPASNTMTEFSFSHDVKVISGRAFVGCADLIRITIPNSVVTLCSYAFSGCKSLFSITIPNSVKYIFNNVFYNCDSLTNITFDENSQLSSIGSEAFYSCDNLDNIIIPDSVTSIGDSAFRVCKGLTNISIGKGVTTIGDYAFSSCTGLTSITIPDGVTSIGRYVFYSCTGLTTIVIPDSVISIGEYAFYGCTSLTDITIPNNVTSIGQYALYNCANLTSVTFDENSKLETIGFRSFASCGSLTRVALPNGLTGTNNESFKDCVNLTEVIISESVTAIGSATFSGCSSLTRIVFLGTMEQWNNMYIGPSWNTNAPITEIVCSDGIIAL